MRIAIISDTHDNFSGTEAALKIIAREKVDTIIHCGDMTSGSEAELFHGFCVHHVLGNNDFDSLSIDIAISGCKPGSSSDFVYNANIDGKWIAAVHGHRANLFYTLLESDRYDYIFVGHEHRKSDRMMGNTRVINPGAIGGARRGERGFCILDLETGELTDYVTD